MIPSATENGHPPLNIYVEARPVQLLRHLLLRLSGISYHLKLQPQLMDWCISQIGLKSHNALLAAYNAEVILVF